MSDDPLNFSKYEWWPIKFSWKWAVTHSNAPRPLLSGYLWPLPRVDQTNVPGMVGFLQVLFYYYDVFQTQKVILFCTKIKNLGFSLSLKIDIFPTRGGRGVRIDQKWANVLFEWSLIIFFAPFIQNDMRIVAILNGFLH